MLFFELIQIALGTRTSLSRIPAKDEWQVIYDTANKQAVVGLLLNGIESLPEEQRPSQELLFQWIGETVQIEQQNRLLDTAANHLYRIFQNGNMRSCVLKGQGISTLYPQPLRRQSGDIDLWVEGGRKKVLKYLKDSFFGTGKVLIHHVDACIIDGVTSEVHFMPGYTYNPFRHRNIQRFFTDCSDQQFNNYDKQLGFCYPTKKFNVVYILSHIFMHFLYEGIGMRQMVDYYYVLKSLNDEERKEACNDIRLAGLADFGGAAMYVLNKVMGMEMEFLICPPDKKRGELLLKEILRGGNFGKFDNRLQNREGYGRIMFNLPSWRRQLSFLRYYPTDIICIPFWKIGHWCWRKWNGYL